LNKELDMKTAVCVFFAGVTSAMSPLAWAQDTKPGGTGLQPALEEVARFDGPMPTGVTVSAKGRIFVNFPRWGDPVDFTVAEIKDGKAVPFPDAAINRFGPSQPATTLLSVQSVVVDPADRLWALDTGNPKFEGVIEGGAKLVAFDLAKNALAKTIPIPPSVALKTTYLNDLRFDLRRGTEGLAFITDSALDGPNGIIVVDLGTGRSFRKLHDHPSTKAEREFLPFVEGRPLMNREPGKPPSHLTIGSDGIAISADGERLYYCPLASRRLYSVAVDALSDAAISEGDVARTVVDHGEKSAADGLETDEGGAIYATSYEHAAILRRRGAAPWEILVQDPALQWPDTLSVAADGHLYVMSNQLHRQARFHDGRDLRVKPYRLFRVKIDVRPVRLARE
jgi:sugar lactone lactonase YvrE